jgi:SAM-dependent methyltransferase
MNHAALYQDDLAYIHHAGFGDFAREAAPELLRLLRKSGIRGGTLVDLACGSGIWADIAHRQGFRVLGIDQSAAMLRLAEKVAPGARFRCASLHKCKLPACDVVTIIGEGLNYLMPGERRPRLKPLFERVAEALQPGGVFIFDVMVREGERLSYRRWRDGNDWVVLFEVEESLRQRMLERRNIVFRRVAGQWRRSEETHRVRLFTQEEVVRALRRAGFAVQVVRRYGTFRLLPHRRGFIARKAR